jgi:hypothetical protein
MALIAVNDSMKSLLLKDSISDVTDRTEDVIVSLFNGPMPTKADFLAGLSYYSDGWVNASTMLSYLTSNGATALLHAEYNNFAFREQVDITKMRFNLSKRSETFNGIADGEAQFFLAFEQDEAGAYATAAVRWGIMGTVGLTGSGADLELPDVNILTSKRYRLNDLIANYQINGINT